MAMGFVTRRVDNVGRDKRCTVLYTRSAAALCVRALSRLRTAAIDNDATAGPARTTLHYLPTANTKRSVWRKPRNSYSFLPGGPALYNLTRLALHVHLWSSTFELYYIIF